MPSVPEVFHGVVIVFFIVVNDAQSFLELILGMRRTILSKKNG